MDKPANTSSSRLRSLGFRFMPTLITVVIVAGIFYFYLTVVVNRNEVELQERKFRGLHQIAENLKVKIERYQEKNVDNFLVHLGSLNKPGKTITSKADTSVPNQALRKEYGLSERKRIDTSNKPIVTTKRYQGLDIDPVEKSIIFYKDGKDSCASTQISDFLEPLLRKSVFSQYLLAFNGNIIYDELNNSYDTLQHFISKSVESDTIRNVSYNPTGQVLTVTVGGKKYRLFTQRFIVSKKESFSIGGYLPEDEYLQESNYVPTYLIVWMIIGVVLAIILVPLVRIFLLHASEQLTTMAATSAFAAAHILASLTMLTLMGVFVYFVVFRQTDNKKLKDLADQIETNLNEEIVSGIETIKKANQLLLSETHSKDVLLSKKSPDVISGKYVDDTTNLQLLNRQQAPEFSHIIWVDSTGQQLLRWTTDVTVPVKISVFERDYFQAILKDNVFYTKNNEPYFFGAISSWVSSKSLAAISLPYNYNGGTPVDTKNKLLPNLKAVYMTGQFQSLYAPVLPNGYGFCVIDENGKVLFHKDEQKNLTENFVRECSNVPDLKTRISNRIEGYFDGNYMGLFQRFFYQPISGTRYSVITYKDKQATWEEDLDIITVCSILLLTNLVLILAVFLHIRFTSYTNSRIKEKGFSFTWLRPNFALKADYVFISLFYAMSMILQSGYLLLGTGDDNAGILESTFAYSYILLLTTHHRFAMVLDPQEPPRKLHKRFLLLLIPYLVLTILFMLICTKDCLLPIAVQAGHFLLYIFVTPWILTTVTSLNRSINKKLGSMSKSSLYYWQVISVNMTFRRIFTSFAFSLILATSVVPVIIFYSLCYHEENHQSVSYAQLDFARRLPRDGSLIRHRGENPIGNTIHSPYYYKAFADTVQLETTGIFTEQTPALFSRLYSYIKPSFSRYSKQLELMGDAKGVDNEFHWVRTPGADQLALYYRFGARVAAKGAKDTAAKAMISKQPYDWKIVSGRDQSIIASKVIQSSTLLIIFVSLILLTGFYLLVSKLIRKIFFEGSADSSYLKETNRDVADIFQIRGNLFVHAMPGSDIPDRENWEPTAKYLNSGEDVLATVNVQESLTANSFIISGINPLRTDHATLEKLVGFVEYLIAEKRKVVLISNINQHRYSAAMQQHQELSARWEAVRKCLYHVNATCSDIFANRLVTLSNTTNLELQLIHSINKSYEPFANQPQLSAEEELLIHNSCAQLVEKLAQECRYTDFLPSCFSTLIKFSSRMSVSIFEDIAEVPRGALKKVVENRLKFVFENACLQLKEIASNFYEELWSSLDLDEQRTLYDIAVDDLVNPANRKTAARLAELGIIRAEKYISCYRLFNESFRSFVFDHVAKNEITAFKAEIKQQGRTGNLLLPLGITIIACIVFIFTTQKDAFLDLITYLGAAAAGITGILKVISIIPNSKSASS